MKDQFVKVKRMTDITPAGNTVTRPSDIFDQIAALAATSMGLTAGTVGQLTQLGASVIEGLKRWAGSTIALLTGDPLLSAFRAMITQTNFISKDPNERNAWLAHMLAIIKGETGGTMNPSATNKAADGRILAYGLMQHTPSNWSYHSYNFADSTIGKAVAASPLIRSFSAALGDTNLSIMRPVNKYGPQNSYFYQLVPMLAQTRSLADRFNKTWYWDQAKGWTVQPNIPNRATLQDWTNKLLGKLTLSYIGGRQAILTILHTNGVNWTNNPKYPLYWDKRFQADVNAVGTLLSDPQLSSVVVKPAVVELPEVSVTPTNTSPSAKRIIITALFGDTSIPEHSEGHGALDIAAVYQPLYAVARAKVIRAAQNSISGKHIIMKTDSGYTISYSHMSTLNVSEGDVVLPLQRVGVSGNTGVSTSPHVHIKVRNQKGVPIDPLDKNVPFNYNNVLYNVNYAGKGDYLFKHRKDKVLAEKLHPYLAGVTAVNRA